MSRISMFPTVFEDVLKINISKLKGWGYLTPNQWKSGQLNWTRNGSPNGEISIAICTQEGNEYLHLRYSYRDQPRDYQVQLIKKLSNLGKGEMWFFKCPKTGKLCRKLYSIGGYFYHREAFKGYYYESQLRSKTYRDIEKQYKGYFSLDRYYEELYSKNLKKTYRGMPTKRYLKLTEKIRMAERIESIPKFL
ncbi:hypothetical protein [Algoriphagus persicinus]|uniref:hypothetical protein n=1 Tax=Algoriphagus persicinus TaxID=3108754 RepID=UPI002B39B945|nr:hypothetical protein [Algoriphagus sp. E1-3-M2]MEB2786009.1 hypothetical protein [Algoriphagus sp. E1-3-M2]